MAPSGRLAAFARHSPRLNHLLGALPFHTTDIVCALSYRVLIQVKEIMSPRLILLLGVVLAGPASPDPVSISPRERMLAMLYTIAVVLIILWLLGFVSSYTMGGLIHVLLVIAVAVVLLRVITGRKPL